MQTRSHWQYVCRPFPLLPTSYCYTLLQLFLLFIYMADNILVLYLSHLISQQCLEVSIIISLLEIKGTEAKGA